MNSHDLLLIAIGSFLPNNMIGWLFRWCGRKLKGYEKNHPKLISPRRYYQLFESDPHTQYHYHKRMQKFWLINFIPMGTIVAFDIWATLTPGHTKYVALLTAVILALNTIYSLYANFDTETGDAHAAYASLRADEIQQDTKNIDTEEGIPVDQLDSVVDQVEAWSLPEA